MFICEISIIILICRNFELIEPMQQKIKLPSPNGFLKKNNRGFLFGTNDMIIKTFTKAKFCIRC